MLRLLQKLFLIAKNEHFACIGYRSEHTCVLILSVNRVKIKDILYFEAESNYLNNVNIQKSKTTSLLSFFIFQRVFSKNGQRVYNTLVLTDVYNQEDYNEQ